MQVLARGADVPGPHRASLIELATAALTYCEAPGFAQDPRLAPFIAPTYKAAVLQARLLGCTVCAFVLCMYLCV